jgi:hypothetical protein
MISIANRQSGVLGGIANLAAFGPRNRGGVERAFPQNLMPKTSDDTMALEFSGVKGMRHQHLIVALHAHARIGLRG